jgi:hypothetical protein
MVVDQYYAGDGAQATCNETGSAAGESARVKLRYAYFE